MATTLPDGLKVQPSIPDTQHSSETLSSPRSKHDDATDNSDSEAWEPFDDPYTAAIPTNARAASPNIGEQREDRDGDDEDDGWVRNPNNPAEMSKWSGQPSIKGSSDTVRMLLLNFSTLGIV